MVTGRWISALWTGALVHEAVAAGARREVLERSAGLPTDSARWPELRVSERRHLATWSAAMQELRDPGFPIRFGQALTPDSYDTLGLACKTASDLRDALDVLSRYLPIWTNTVRCLVSEPRGGLRVELQRRSPRNLGMRCANESAVAELLHALRAMVADPVPVVRACFAHRRPADTTVHERYFAAPLVFDARFDGVELALSSATLPLRLADQGLSRYLRSELQRKAERVVGSGSFVDALRNAIADALPDGTAELPAIAQRLALSPRTLQRRLREDGTSFHAELRATRRAVAERLLASGQRPVAEVAFLVGYAEASAFHRAFKRWTGQTPRAFQRESP